MVWRSGVTGLRRLALLLPLTLLAACVTSPPDTPAGAAGQFSGSVVVIWLGDGDGTSGDGRFLFVPQPNDPLRFRRPGKPTRAAVVEPQMMYTDGGSIPTIAQGFKGLQPWAYAPAYMIHDWLFVAEHCRRDGDPDPAYQDTAGITFQDSAAILDEAIVSLMKTGFVRSNDVARGAIKAAVSSPIARGLWNKNGACAREKVSEADRARVAALFRRAEPALRTFGATSAAPVSQGIRILGSVSF